MTAEFEGPIDESAVEKIDFGESGLIPGIAQDVHTREVRMQAFVNQEALLETLRTGFAHYWSRSRDELWKKGQTSGNLQRIQSVRTDCDQDSLLYMIEQEGVTCHTGKRHCFHYRWDGNRTDWLEEDPSPDQTLGTMLAEIESVVRDRDRNRPAGSYTTSLLEGTEDKEALDLILEKFGEEVTESILAAKNNSSEELSEELADMLYHLVVLCRKQDLPLDELTDALAARR